MKTLKDITEVAVNNNECVVLKVREGCEMDLIALGCFDGAEAMFRLTKGGTVTCTVFKKDGKSFDWHWGFDGYTLVSPKMKDMGRKIQHCIERLYGIECER